MNTHKPYVRVWLFGFLLSTLFIWIVGTVFLPAVPDWRICDSLNLYVRNPGSVHRHFSEGYGISVYGKYGIIGIQDAANISYPKIIVWGDSFVEGYQVADEKKLAQQISTEWSLRHPENSIVGVGVAESGRAVADHYNLMPDYERLLNPLFHVILIAGFSDLSPDGVSFHDTPEYKISEYRDTKRFVEFRRVLNTLSLNFFYSKLLRIMDSGVNLRFSPGKAKMTNQCGSDLIEKEQVPVEAWDYLIKMLRQRTTLPVLIIYTPPVPEIHSGKLMFSDKYSSLSETDILAEICRKHNVGYIDMSARNIAHYLKTRHFPRGFNNGGFTTGHCNEIGFKLIAEAVCDYIEEGVNGIYTD